MVNVLRGPSELLTDCLSSIELLVFPDVGDEGKNIERLWRILLSASLVTG
jgi:hypothetical protein